MGGVYRRYSPFGTDEGIIGAGHHKKRFAFLIEFPVHESHLEFIFKIGNGAKTADHGASIEFRKRIDQESLE